MGVFTMGYSIRAYQSFDFACILQILAEPLQSYLSGHPILVNNHGLSKACSCLWSSITPSI